MKLCDWSALDTQTSELLAKIEGGLQATPPFAVLAITSAPALQRKAAEIVVNERHPASPVLPPIPKRARQKKVRIGYYSADYHNHPTAYLMAGLFERHDRGKFELVAFSFGPDREDEMRRRVSAAFDQFIDVRDKADKDVALLSRNMAVDIAVDLKGFTQGHRAGIFSYGAAPIQVNYLGYPGTMGAKYIDYLIADRTLIPEDFRQHCSERIVYLPDSYQVNDRQRAIADRVFLRDELGLPQQGFVFCCFNNNFKITPATFDGWMRILKQVDGSVLWLLEDNPTASRHLRKEAEARGVSAGRLVFAGRMPLADHLARHRAADLFVDTLPCNAHTTASDALWAGLPVLTCMGEAFASRVAASLLNAIDLPELVTTSQEQYEALAVELATNPERIGQIKQKLERNRLTTPLFDTQLFTTRIEDAYTQMYERYQSDLPPHHIYVASEPVRRIQRG
jgi:predicted O-linked N-acetylglucosamine transferase (SPINDLY family)